MVEVISEREHSRVGCRNEEPLQVEIKSCEGVSASLGGW